MNNVVVEVDESKKLEGVDYQTEYETIKTERDNLKLELDHIKHIVVCSLGNIWKCMLPCSDLATTPILENILTQIVMILITMMQK